MASGTRELTLKLVAQTEGMQKELQGAGGTMKKIGKGMLAMGAAGAAAFSVDKIVDFGKETLTLASDVAESTSKVQTVYGKSSDAVIQFAKDSNKSMGLADKDAMEYMGTLGAMYTGLGSNQEQSALLSSKTMQLAADLGSFNNVSTPETLDMMSSAFRGEYDSIQRMLPGMTGAAVETQALMETGKKSAKELTAQDKAMASLNLMYKQAGPAIGDFARTSSGAANQQKIMASEMEDMKTSIGNALLPTFTLLIKTINDYVLPGIKWFVSWVADVGVPALIAAWDFAWTYIKPVFDMLSRLVMDYYNILKNVIGFIINIVTGDWAGAWDSFKKIFKYAIDFVMGYVNLFWHYIQAIWNGIVLFIRYVGPLILDYILWPYKLAWSLIKDIAGGIWHGIQWVWDGMLNTLKAAGNGIYDAITWPFKTAWEFIKRTWNSTLGKIHFQIPGWVPGLGGKEWKMPQLARGGIVTRPTMALIGEAGPEAVVPLHGSRGLGGNVYNINVSTGIGDPFTIGQTVVKALQDYERVAGPRRSGARGGAYG